MMSQRMTVTVIAMTSKYVSVRVKSENEYQRVNIRVHTLFISGFGETVAPKKL